MDASQMTPPAGDSPRPRRRAPALTIPEQIAARVATAIVNGEYRDGERLREQELAEAYGVSRGPVREALRALERYGLAVLLPRRGAYVVGLSLDVIAEAFNARAVLAGVAARQLARQPAATATAIEEMEAALDYAVSLLDRPAEDAAQFQHAMLSTAFCVYRNCGPGHIERQLTDQLDRSIYGLMWRAAPLDFQRLEQRLDSIEAWRRVLAALKVPDEQEAERAVRRDILRTRDRVIEGLAAVRGETVDPGVMFRD